jgi:hypothetical protein
MDALVGLKKQLVCMGDETFLGLLAIGNGVIFLKDRKK